MNYWTASDTFLPLTTFFYTQKYFTLIATISTLKTWIFICKSTSVDVIALFHIHKKCHLHITRKYDKFHVKSIMKEIFVIDNKKKGERCELDEVQMIRLSTFSFTAARCWFNILKSVLLVNWFMCVEATKKISLRWGCQHAKKSAQSDLKINYMLIVSLFSHFLHSLCALWWKFDARNNVNNNFVRFKSIKEGIWCDFITIDWCEEVNWIYWAFLSKKVFKMLP